MAVSQWSLLPLPSVPKSIPGPGTLHALHRIHHTVITQLSHSYHTNIIHRSCISIISSKNARTLTQFADISLLLLSAYLPFHVPPNLRETQTRPMSLDPPKFYNPFLFHPVPHSRDTHLPPLEFPLGSPPYDSRSHPGTFFSLHPATFRGNYLNFFSFAPSNPFISLLTPHTAISVRPKHYRQSLDTAVTSYSRDVLLICIIHYAYSTYLSHTSPLA